VRDWLQQSEALSSTKLSIHCARIRIVMRPIFVLLASSSLLASCDPDTSGGPVNTRASAQKASPTQAVPLEPPSDKPSATSPREAYTVSEQTAEEVATGLGQACKQAKENGGRLLIEFSAPWCGDCRRLAEMKMEAVLSDKLKGIPYFVVNVGDFDRHEGLLRAFEVRSIARWQVVEASDCDTPPGGWRRIAHRTLEPKTGKPVTAEELAGWIERMFSAS
jgi:thiol-disulfide isomerase/thioredoxin